MSNVIQIKHGNGVPDGKLAPYELGYSDDKKELYIGGQLDENNQYGQAISLNPGTAPTLSAVPTTTLLKSKSSDSTSQILDIYCHNLQKNTPYKLYLYTLQKTRGNASRYWRHPNNRPSWNQETDELERGRFSGYANLAGEKMYPDPKDDTLFPWVPDWMPKGGVLQTEWNFTTGNKDTYVFNLNLCEWILDLLKYREDDDKWILMGLTKKNNLSRLFQFKVVSPDGSVGNTNNILALSRVERGNQDEALCHIGYFSIKQ